MTVFGGRVLWEVLRSWALMGRQMPAQAESQDWVHWLPLLPFCLVPCEDSTRRPLPNASILILDFPVSKTKRSKFLCIINEPVLGIVITAQNGLRYSSPMTYCFWQLPLYVLVPGIQYTLKFFLMFFETNSIKYFRLASNSWLSWVLGIQT